MSEHTHREVADLHRRAAERLEARDQRYTAGRRRIVEVLGAAGPLTLPDLLAAAGGLPQSSAYRNLTFLEEAGVVRRLVHGGDHAHYELAEDLTEHHHHLICVSCGVVRDVSLGDRIERSLDGVLDTVAAAHDFTPSHHAIDIYGHCAQCADSR